MTEISLHLNEDGEIVGFSGEGHTEGQPLGQDVVCAAITTVFDMLSRGAQDLPSSAVDWEHKPSRPSWRLVVDPDQLSSQHWREYQRMLTAAGLVLRNIVNEYPERCQMGKASKSS